MHTESRDQQVKEGSVSSDGAFVLGFSPPEFLPLPSKITQPAGFSPGSHSRPKHTWVSFKAPLQPIRSVGRSQTLLAASHLCSAGFGSCLYCIYIAFHSQQFTADLLSLFKDKMLPILFQNTKHMVPFGKRVLDIQYVSISEILLLI